MRINIVYDNANMPSAALGPFETAAGASVQWTRRARADSDVVVYFNHYAHRSGDESRLPAGTRRFLYLYDPVAVDPVQYTAAVWRRFDRVLTWHRVLAESHPLFACCPNIFYDLPYTDVYGLRPGAAPPRAPAERERSICMIAGDKYSLSPEALYGMRRDVAHWFHDRARLPMAVYGWPPTPVPNYRGRVGDKLDVLSRHRFCLCLENTHDDFWSRGYVTEKLFDCLVAGCIPVYCGAPDVADIVPPTCFIDLRWFDSLAALEAYLLGMSAADCADMQASMSAFVADYRPWERHASARLYEAISRTAAGSTVAQDPARPFPHDYAADPSLALRARLRLTELVLSHPRRIPGLFDLVRRLPRRRRRRAAVQGPLPLSGPGRGE